MQTAIWNSESAELNDVDPTYSPCNSGRMRENRNGEDTIVPSCSTSSSLFLNLQLDIRNEEQDVTSYEHGSGTLVSQICPETSSPSFLVTYILKVVLSPTIGEGSVEAMDDNITKPNEGFERTTHVVNLSEEEKRAERNRKGRERSMRTRRRNAAHLKMLENGCTKLIMENQLLRDLLSNLQMVPSREEKVTSLLRHLLSRNLPTILHPAGELSQAFLSASMKPVLTYEKTNSSVEDKDGPRACDKLHEPCSSLRHHSQTSILGKARKNDTYAPRNWKPQRCLKSLPESSNVSKTSTSIQKGSETKGESVSQGHFHISVCDTSEIRQEDKLVDFSLDEIDAVISL